MFGYIDRFMFLSAIVGAVCTVSGPAYGGYPGQLYHQGVIAVHGERFTGEGDFRFALVDRDTDAYLWVNDGSGVATPDPPTNPVTLTVVNGIYNVRLGDESLTDMQAEPPSIMTPIPRAVFNEDNVVLRIWFNDGVNGVYRLEPDQVLTSVPYAQRLPNVFVDEDTGNVGIGTTAPDNALSVDGDADFSGKVGLGTPDPQNTLDVEGRAVIGATYAGATSGPPDGLLVQGSVGLGTNSPQNKLDVEGGAVVGSAYAGSEPAPPNGLLVEGNVGIGTKNPQNKLDVEGSAVVGSSYSGLTTAPADSLLVEGSIGIGTSNPQNKLDVEGGAVVGRSYSGTKTAPSDGLLVEGNVGIATATPTNELSVSGNADFTGNVGIGTSSPQNKLDVEGGAVVGHSYSGTYTAPSNGLLVEGNVGIGTDEPANALSVVGNADFSGNVGIGTATPGAPLTFENALGNKISLWGQDGGTDHFGLGVGDYLMQLYVPDTSSIAFGTGRSGAFSEKMRIRYDGNIGIGTSDPQATLDVHGTTKILGTDLPPPEWLRCDADNDPNCHPSTEDGTFQMGGLVECDRQVIEQGTLPPMKTLLESTTSAPSDGFVVVNAHATYVNDNWSTNYAVFGVITKEGNEQVRASLSVNGVALEHDYSGDNSFVMPVRKGESWRVGACRYWLGNYEYAKGQIWVEWIPLGQ